MDTFVDSSWYFYRYTSPDRRPRRSTQRGRNYWFPIDQYIGGVEHAILHLIYSRFWTKFMRDIGLVDNSEPAARLFTQGMVIKDGSKMSKSRGNVVSPDDMVARYGADSTRLYTLFAAPPDRDLDWQDAGVEGVSRFLLARLPLHQRELRSRPSGGESPVQRRRVHSPGARKIQRKLHQTIRRITEDFVGRWHFNTSIAAIMELVNDLYAQEESSQKGTNRRPATLRFDVQRNFVLHARPLRALRRRRAMGDPRPRPPTSCAILGRKFDPALAKEDEVEMAVQVNGKFRAPHHRPRRRRRRRHRESAPLPTRR